MQIAKQKNLVLKYQLENILHVTPNAICFSKALYVGRTMREIFDHYSFLFKADMKWICTKSTTHVYKNKKKSFKNERPFLHIAVLWFPRLAEKVVSFLHCAVKGYTSFEIK